MGGLSNKFDNLLLRQIFWEPGQDETLKDVKKSYRLLGLLYYTGIVFESAKKKSMTKLGGYSGLKRGRVRNPIR